MPEGSKLGIENVKECTFASFMYSNSMANGRNRVHIQVIVARTSRKEASLSCSGPYSLSPKLVFMIILMTVNAPFWL
ncbi:MAG: hypothetical protein WC244_00230 [Patescibacteria group bacterium]